MDARRAEILLNRIVAAVGKDVMDGIDRPRLRQLAAKALCEPMTITPSEIRELARTVLHHMHGPSASET